MSLPADRPRTRLLAAVLVLLITALPAAGAQSRKEKKQSRKEIAAAVEELPERYQRWLEEVAVLISDEEKAAFLELTQDYHRDAFIDRFWQARDPYPGTGRNEFLRRWERRVSAVRARYGSLEGALPETLLIHGEPAEVLELDCGTLLWPAEIWAYAGSDRAGFPFTLLFYQRWGNGPYRIWQPADGLDDLFQDYASAQRGNPAAMLGAIRDRCYRGDMVAGILAGIVEQGPAGYAMLVAEIRERPEAPEGEWVTTFAAYTTDLDPGAVTFDAELDVAYPGRRQSRTVVQGVVTVPAAAVEQVELGEHRSYNFVLTGEVIADEALFDSFRYSFEFLPSEIEGGVLPMAFERYLRPGDYRMVIKLEDLNGKRFFRAEQPLAVPEVEDEPPPPPDPETARLLAEANAIIATGDVSLKLVRPVGELLTGYHRIDTLVTSPEKIDRVAFLLDEQTVLTKKRPPYEVELDLGDLPRPRTLAAVAYDAAGEELASDELLLNAGDHRFEVRLVEPSRGRTYEDSLRARAEVEVPEGRSVERVEFFLNETRVATLYQPPFVQPIVLPEGAAVAYVQAVAYLPDGNSTQDLVFINAPDVSDELNIEYVELYTSVFDRQGRPVTGLERTDFRIAEDGVAQTPQRFELVKNLPIHTAVLLDVSASMEDRLVPARDAALAFFQQTLSSKDRAAIITFNDRPHLEVKFTNGLTDLAGGLAGLKAERGTALYDSLIFGLYYFNGIKGQRAMLVLSDGKDESSRFDWEDALEYARRAGVTLYAIGLDLPKSDARRKLARLAEETGGRSFFIADPRELAAIYAAIEEELRSQYLLTYQSTNTSADSDFRVVEVEVDQPGLEAKTIRGYYPG